VRKKGVVRRRWLAVVASVALLASLAACSLEPQAEPDTTSSPTGETPSAELAPFYTQELEWSSCENGYQCATADAPLDWADPGGDSIELAVIRTPATSSNRIGSLLVNPGGPGGSGVDFVANSENGGVAAEVHEQFDVVGFDPRGVGQSTAVSCYDDPSELDDYLFGDVDGEIGSDEWLHDVVDSTKEFGQSCLEHTGPLLGHVDTESSARDMDMLRAVLGDEKLYYLGYSYGTLLGATYAELFPEKTGRLVLDGAFDPSATLAEVVSEQIEGFEGAYRAYLESCLSGDDCPFDGSVDDAMEDTARLLDALDESPLRNADGRDLDASAMTLAIQSPLYSEVNWPYLTQSISDVLHGDADLAFQLIDSYLDRNADGTYFTNTQEAFTAIDCLDFPADGTFDEARADAAELAEIAPTLGTRSGYSAISCSGWPFPATRTPGPITAAGSADILVVGTTNDPATPYIWAQSLSEQLENGYLLTYDGEGHTAYGRSNDCVDDTVNEYFLNGTVPAEDPLC
jgi:pimeloyl-ACP methyl ester carboxylesterase